MPGDNLRRHAGFSACSESSAAPKMAFGRRFPLDGEMAEGQPFDLLEWGNGDLVGATNDSQSARTISSPIAC